MNYTYKLRTDTIFDEDGCSHIVYGIDVVNSDNSIKQSVPDIFFDLDKATRFVHTCNKLKLEYIHLFDVIEDILD